ncbi:MAG: acyl-CoA dehydrogenase family protein [Deltaproteobacteria bacterium]|nr:acyl-CoA dehydrogenase family protein [Deltaproteobacteria bacterium]
MHFAFEDEHLRFRDSVRGVLDRVCAPAAVRKVWEDAPAHDAGRWRALAELGLLGLLAPERAGGLGLDEVSMVLALEETGRAALPEAIVDTALVAVPLLAGLEDHGIADPWLGRIAAGEVVVGVGCQPNPWVAHADAAELLLLVDRDEIHALPRAEVRSEPLPHLDAAQRLFRVAWTPSARTRVAAGAHGRRLHAAAVDRGALGAAAQLLGVAARLIEEAVGYAKQREQFGREIGSFQAIKHRLANARVRLEFARPVVYRAAFGIARDLPARGRDASHAKLVAADAAAFAARAALQVHGAIGYTWEVDLHVWMKRAWALETTWGTSGWHRGRLAAAVLDPHEEAS